MKKKIGASVITVFVLLTLLFVDSTLGLGVGKGLQVFVRPVGLVVSDTGMVISGFFGNLFNIGDLQNENSELKQKLDSVIAEIAMIKTAKEENESLKRDLGFKNTANLNLIPGNVTSFDPTLRSGINVYVDDSSGIVVGRPVIAEGYLIGKVAEVRGNTIKVTLIVDSTSAIPAEVLDRGITGIAKGIIGNGLVMDQIPQSDVVAEGDIVVTSGLGGELPKGLVIAKVGEIQRKSGSIFQSVELLPMIDFSKIERVMIAK